MQALSLSTQLVSVRELRTVKSGVTVTVVCVETVNTRLWKKVHVQTIFSLLVTAVAMDAMMAAYASLHHYHVTRTNSYIK